MRFVMMAAGIATGMTACSREPLTQEEADEVAESTAPLLREDASSEAGATEVAVDIALGDSWLSRDVSGSWEGLIGGASLSFEVDCFDASNTEIDCSSDTVRADVATLVDASLDLPRVGASFFRDARWELDELDGRGTLEGGATTEITSRLSSWLFGTERTWRLFLEGDYDLVGIREEGALAGTIEWDAVAEEQTTDREGSDSRSLVTTVDVRFEDGHAVEMIVDRTYRYDIDENGDLTSTGE